MEPTAVITEEERELTQRLNQPIASISIAGNDLTNVRSSLATDSRIDIPKYNPLAPDKEDENDTQERQRTEIDDKQRSERENLER